MRRKDAVNRDGVQIKLEKGGKKKKRQRTGVADSTAQRNIQKADFGIHSSRRALQTDGMRLTVNFKGTFGMGYLMENDYQGRE